MCVKVKKELINVDRMKSKDIIEQFIAKNLAFILKLIGSDKVCGRSNPLCGRHHTSVILI